MHLLSHLIQMNQMNLMCLMIELNLKYLYYLKNHLYLKWNFVHYYQIGRAHV
jgi:hypothetical protein